MIYLFYTVFSQKKNAYIWALALKFALNLCHYDVIPEAVLLSVPGSYVDTHCLFVASPPTSTNESTLRLGVAARSRPTRPRKRTLWWN